MMSNISEEEISRRLALLPTVLQSLDHQVKVALVQNGCYETIRFPTTERSWERLAEKCGFDEGTLNLVRNLVNPPQSQQGKLTNSLISSIASSDTFLTSIYWCHKVVRVQKKVR